VDRRHVVHDPGDVGERVHPVARGEDDALDIGLVGDVAGDRDDLGSGRQAGQRGRELVQPLRGDVRGDDPPALAGDPGRDGAADARGRTRDDHGLAREAAGSDLLDPAGRLLVLGIRLGGLVGSCLPVGGDQAVERRGRELAARQCHQLLQRQAAGGRERVGGRAALGEDAGEDLATDGVVEPLADGGVNGQCHGVLLGRDGYRTTLSGI
jgi:hypothetical protein